MKSSDKCNRLIEEDLVRGSEAQALTRTVVKTLSDIRDVVVREGLNGRSFRDVLPDKAVCVLDGASLPGRVRVGKEEISREVKSDPLMVHEFHAVVRGDGCRHGGGADDLVGIF